MTYDNYGNITTKNGVYFGYSSLWKDKLIAIGSKSVEYDAQGNPTNYFGNTLTWEKGRQLKSFNGVSFTYNANGIRTAKNANGTEHKYMLDGTKILRETWKDNTLIPLYDNEDSVCGIEHNGTAYYFLKNLQGDVIAILDSLGKTVARYSYDAWGAFTITQDDTDCHIAIINPFRYRGYYFDEDVNLYYLQSRYYDCGTGRFVNGDMAEFAILQTSTITHNLYCYCHNNIINLSDKSGRYALPILLKVAVLAFLSIAMIGIVSSPNTQKNLRDFCTSISYGISEGLKSIGGIISSTIKNLSAQSKAIAQSITDSFARAKSRPKYKNKRELHHIVAKKAKNAVYARNIINKVGIGYNSPKNLVYVKTGLHRRLHTKIYYGWANSVVISAYNSAKGGKTKQRKNVITALDILRAFILVLNEISPY